MTIYASGVRADDAIAGVYDVTGVSPGGGSYAGVAQIVATGETYGIVWKIGPETYKGMGVATGNSLAVVYVGGKLAGVVLYERISEDTWCGIWASANDRRVGREMLVLQSSGRTRDITACDAIHAILSTSSSDRFPGTIVTGTRSLPTNLLVRAETNGPGPRGPVAAPSTRMEMVGSSSISFSSSSRRSPSRT
jgi:hypothetical protein